MVTAVDASVATEQLYVEDTVAKVHAIAAKLRRTADEIEGYAAKIPTDSSYAVSQIVHAAVWGTANLDLSILIACEGRIHQARESRIPRDDRA